MHARLRLAAALAGALLFGTALGWSARAQEAKPMLGYKDTPLLPGGKWHVHDGDRPQPTVIDPGSVAPAATPGKPPSDAIVLFDGTNLDEWRDGSGRPTRWKVEDGAMVAVRGAGQIISRKDFGDCQLHIEWATPSRVEGNGQGRGNSGVFFFDGYEIQVLDSYKNLTYPDGQAAALYGQYPPLVNACRPPGEWQSYDIAWRAPRFKEGQLESPAMVTVFHNGVVVHSNTEVMGPMIHRQFPKYRPHAARGPISMQDHGNPVRYRNIWVRELKPYDTP